jgi:hypothetical protein
VTTSARPDLDAGRVAAECDVRFTRRSGPGGQNRNKVETAAVLAHRPTGLTAEANERRSQGENRAAALFRLRVALALEVRRHVEHDAEPSALWRSRVQGGKVRVNPEHDDFPPLLAEALDHVASDAFDPRVAAERLGCTATQIVRFLALEPRALAVVNAGRTARGLHPLR